MNKRYLCPALLLLFAMAAPSLAGATPVFLPLLLKAATPAPGLTPTPIQPDYAFVSRVIDGDTVELSTGQRVRYIGIDAPEVTGPECYALEAKAKNAELVEGKWVRLEKDVSETDRYGRLLRYVWVMLPWDETMVNAQLLAEGYALVATYPPDVKYVEWFLELQRIAREEGRGLWSACVTPTPTPTTGVAPAQVRIAPWCSQFDAPGNDNYNLNEEYVCFENQGGSAASMTGWHVKDVSGHIYTFPLFTLASGARVRLRTGPGPDTATDLYWGKSGAVWNNDGDTVYLYDAGWNLVHSYSY